MSKPTTTRFDPTAGADYAVCSNCTETFSTREGMSAHLSATFAGGKSHRAQVTNPTRVERIENELSDLAQNALSDLVDEMQRLVDRDDATEEEISEALRSVHMDLTDAWEETL